MIRSATLQDFDVILPLLILRHKEGRFGSFSLYEVRNRFDLILSGHGIIGVIVNPSGVAEASIGLVLARFWYSRDPHIEDQWNFVHPDYRRTDHAKSLMAFAKGYADTLRMPMFLAQEETADNAPKVRLLERNLKRAGTIFCHEPANA